MAVNLTLSWWNCSRNTARARSSVKLPALVRVMFGALLAALPLAVAPQPAQAAQRQGWIVCNATSYILQGAIARPQSGKQIVEGWIRMRPGECRQAVAAPLTKGNYLLFAQSAPAHRGGQQVWTGDRQLCVDARP